MREDFTPIIESTFRLKENEGQDKVTSLAEAIRQNVKPGMTIYIEEGANAAIRDVLRQFWDSRPQFTLVMAVTSGDALDLVASGLVKKVVAAACVEQRPMLGPSPAIQRASQQKSVEIEDWSLYSLMLRLMAGALGVGFLPTKSLLGSSLAEANQDSFKAMDDPFGSGQRLGLVKALNPDLAIVHALVADRYGNTIMSTPPKACYAGWGARASKGGVVVTVEKLVSTDFIRRHAGLVTLPGQVVKSVSVAPFGAHPEGLMNKGTAAFKSYGEDHQFMDEVRKARRDPGQLNAWVKEWVLDCPSHEEYLKKLGSARLSLIRTRADRDTWEKTLEPLLNNISTRQEYNATEMMIVTAARKVREKVLQRGYRTLLVGAGTPLAATWLAYFQLRKEGYDIEVTNGSGQFGYMPRPGDPSTTNYHSLVTCKMLCDVMQVYGWLVAGTDKCLSVLGGAEIDKQGNINSTLTSSGAHLVGSGGANDASNAAELMLVVTQSPRRFVDKVSYVTVPGSKVTMLISDLGIFEKPAPDKEFILTAYFPQPGGKQDALRRIKEQCGWELKVSADLKEVSPPTHDELTLLRLLDAGGALIRPR